MKPQAIFLGLCLLTISISVNAFDHERVTVYGYFDTEVEVSNTDDKRSIWTFDQHHLNVIAIYKIDNRFRVFSEIEWEHGPSHSGDSTTGKIYLAKSFLEYKHSDAFRVRIGKFLTPFGIYNERHDATPTMLFTNLPRALYGEFYHSAERPFAKFSTGLHLLGTSFIDDWEARYNLYVSNGRGPNPSEKDNNANKAVGGRLVITPPSGTLHAGLSYYRDKNGMFYDSRQSSLGFDLEADVGSLYLNAELILMSVEHLEEATEPREVHHPKGYYFLAGHTFYDRVTPWAAYNWINEDRLPDDHVEVRSVGLNYSLTDKVYLKAEVHSNRFKSRPTEDHELFIASIAAAF